MPIKNTLSIISECEEKKASPVPGAVHGFECEGLLLDLKGEHVLAVVLPVTGGLPQLTVVDVGRHHLLETSLPVLTLPKTNQGFHLTS